jgi:hypothetical protein
MTMALGWVTMPTTNGKKIGVAALEIWDQMDNNCDWIYGGAIPIGWKKTPAIDNQQSLLITPRMAEKDRRRGALPFVPGVRWPPHPDIYYHLEHLRLGSFWIGLGT